MAMIDSSIQYLKGVGPAFVEKFEKLGVTTIRDLLLCYPRKYIDYTKPYTVVSAPYDVDSCVRATVLQKEPVRRIKGGRALVRVLAADDSGVLGLSWFNTPYVADKLIIGQTYYFEGRIGGTMTRRELLHPLVRTEAQVAASPFVAVYPGTEGLPAARQAACAHAALQYVDELTDPLPPELLTRYRMPTKAQAVHSIHAPQSAEDLAGARRRLIFEELYMLQIGIFLLRSYGRRKTSAPMHEMDLAPFWGSLPYAPTGAQKRSTEEIVHDLCGEVPMNRLLQGDVGSGKTLVAAAAIWFAAQNGWQSAMLAPTEILARQHAATLADRLEPFGVNVTLLVGGMKAKEKKVALEAIADGRAGLVVGTHAVLTDSVEFKNLGLAIVDEQHRFGVRQRGLLHGKMKPKEKDEVMLKFKAGELDVLVSTTVIEVGVDVPNATVMVIENAERFGLSALHQLRGRVGRGAADSCCILISDNENDAVKERLRFLCHTSDGFAVAKYDLENRGPGDFFGSAQHGLPTLRVADLVQDTRTLKVAQEEAKALLAVDPNLAMPQHRALSDEVDRLFATAGAMN